MLSSSQRRAAVLLGIALVASGCLSACTSHRAAAPAEQVAAQAFVAALTRGDAAGAAALTDEAAAAQPAIAATLGGLGDGSTGNTARGSATVTTQRTGDAATARATISWTLPGVASPWTYTTDLTLARTDSRWTVRWQTADLYPGLGAGQHLAAVRTAAPRASLTDSAGRALITPTPVVRVGIEPRLVSNATALAATLAKVLGISAGDILAGLKGAKPDAFVPVITLRKSDYLKVRAQIHDLPGTVFDEGSELLGPSSRFAQPLLGRVGPATREIVDASRGRVRAGDQAGLSGLQRALDARLAGTPGVTVEIRADADDATVRTVARLTAPRTAAPVRLTLDRAVQQAADDALADVPQQAAVVALQPSTGAILAVANSAAVTDDIALVGQYPPGSTFKIVTDTAALGADPALGASTLLPCPPTVDVDGRIFENEDRFTVPNGAAPLREAFGRSCNTTAIDLGLRLPDAALADAAGQLGLGARWDLPVDAFSGSLPAPAGQTEKAADAIGQGRVLASPLVMAEIAGAASTGRSVVPSLLAGGSPTLGTAFPARVTATMNDLMRATVQQPYGTAHQLADLPGQVRGKTGTAEFGTAQPPPSHAWFTGVRGDLAFAVFVYAGERSSTTAVPIAHRFLLALS